MKICLPFFYGPFLDYLMKDKSRHVVFVKAPYPTSVIHAGDLKNRWMDVSPLVLLEMDLAAITKPILLGKP